MFCCTHLRCHVSLYPCILGEVARITDDGVVGLLCFANSMLLGADERGYAVVKGRQGSVQQRSRGLSISAAKQISVKCFGTGNIDVYATHSATIESPALSRDSWAPGLRNRPSSAVSARPRPRPPLSRHQSPPPPTAGSERIITVVHHDRPPHPCRSSCSPPAR
jgi:hypothetical protein